MSKHLLTDHLLSAQTRKPYSAAVQHHFLCAAHDRTLSNTLLALWLSQDRIYAAHAYPRFIGGLITKIPFAAHHDINSAQDARNERILSMLTSALQSVMRETRFFLNTANKFELDLQNWKERAATRNYVAEMARVSTWGSLEEGLIFMWAMEKVYLDAWTFVGSGTRSESSENARAIDAFSENWTNEEFVKFVDRLREIVDDLGIGPGPGSELWTRAEAIWSRVVELEVDFWPEIGEEGLESSRK